MLLPKPTETVFPVAPAAPTTAGFGLLVPIYTSLVLVGTPADQLPAVNQSVEAVPVQVVCAWDGIVAASQESAVLPSSRATRLLSRLLFAII